MRTSNGCRILSILLFFGAVSVSSNSQDLIWSANYGGKYNDEGYAGIPTADNCLAIVGSTYSEGAGEFDLYLLKINSAGGIVWSRTYGGIDTEYGYDVNQTSDEGYIMVGSTQSYGRGGGDIYLVRTDSLGNMMWDKSYGGTENDKGCAVDVTSDGGYIICGTTDSYGAGYSDLYLIRANSSGDTLWTRTFGGSGGESGVAVKQTADGGYIAVGSTGSFGDGYSSIYAVRVSSDGDSLWARTFGGTGADFGSAVEIAFDGGFLFSGWTSSFGAGFYDAYLVKTDSDGNFEWQQTYGGSREDRAYSVQLAMDGGYILTGIKEGSGTTLLDIYVIKTDPSGNLIWDEIYGGAKSDIGRLIFQDPGRDYMLIGNTYSYTAGGCDIYILKIQGEATDAPYNDPYTVPSGYELQQNYPNPFNMATQIDFTIPRLSSLTLTIYNILGQVVREWKHEMIFAGRYSVLWDGRTDAGGEVASGMYFYRLTAGEYIETKKMIMVK